LVARFAGTRWLGDLAIARPSLTGGQRDLVDVGRCDLKKRGGRNLVRELCEIEGKEVVQREIKRGSMLTRNQRHPLAVSAVR
jgi:hypothetical protein